MIVCITIKALVSTCEDRGGRMAAESVKRAQILLVDDNESLYFLMKKACLHAELSLDIKWVRDGDELLAYLGQTDQSQEAANPELIVLDLKMPGRGGEEILKEMKANSRLASIPVIVWSNSPVEDIAPACRELGAQDCFTKPAGFKEFIALMQDLAARIP